MNAAWGMICDMDRIALFIDEDHATTNAIRATKAFTVSIADKDHMDVEDYFGITASRITGTTERISFQCRITVIDKKCFTDFQEQYLADPKSGPCPFFHVGDTFLLKRTPAQDDFYHLMDGKFCGEAWDAVSRYVYTALQGGSIMKGWTNDDRIMIACCNDGTRPVIFKIERIDIPENEEEAQWLAKQDFRNTAETAYTG